MPEENEITPYSLCDDCPLNIDGKVCKETLIKPKVIVLVCGNRAKHEAPKKEE